MGKGFVSFTPEELAEMRRYDEMIDNDPDYDRNESVFVNAILFKKSKYAEARKKWQENNRDHIRALSKAYYASHKESERERKKRWYQENRERIRKKQHDTYFADVERSRAYNKLLYQKRRKKICDANV